jgi:hypothetical protein
MFNASDTFAVRLACPDEPGPIPAHAGRMLKRYHEFVEVAPPERPTLLQRRQL